MSSDYFGEHNCAPLSDAAGSVSSEGALHVLRLLLDTGAWMTDEFSSLFASQPPPPASKKFIEEHVKDEIVREDDAEADCPVCLKPFEEGETVNALPCKHKFHKDCIMPWLKKVCTCPLCRAELPSDDPTYEEMKRQKQRKKQREEDIENLHNSMFG